MLLAVAVAAILPLSAADVVFLHLPKLVLKPSAH
jgi:hypothetical protein